MNVPLIIRGPDVPHGVVTDQVTSHTDLVPTIFELAGINSRYDFDGAPIEVREHRLAGPLNTRHEHVNLEYWGFALAEGKYGFSASDPNGKLIGISLHDHLSTTFYNILHRPI